LGLVWRTMRLIWFSATKMNVKRKAEDLFVTSFFIVSPTGC